MGKNYINFLQFLILFVVFTVLPNKINAQCAGTDAQKIICDIENPANETLDLFSLLGGSPTPGGTWSDNNNLKGLDPNTGILKPQLITRGGVYLYTYTAPATSGCTNNKAVITLTIGAYSGLGSQATVCNDDGRFNLFTAFDSNVMGPHSNGIWRNSSGQIVESSLEVGGIDKKTTLQFTYTVPPVIECSPAEKVSTVMVTILRAPKEGKANDLILCGTTDLAGYTNLDLNDRLDGEDGGGTWTGLGITSSSQRNINLQEIFNTYGAGEFVYRYSVLAVPDNNICRNKYVDLTITLEKRLDFTGAKITVSKDICESEISTATYSAKIFQGPDKIPDGLYEVTFEVTGPTYASETVLANFVNGVLNLPMRSTYFQQVGKFTINVIKILSATSKNSCVNIFSPFSTDLTVYPIPLLNGAKLTSIPTCQSQAGLIQINAPQLLDGDYRITYNINGNNVATAQTAIIKSVGGSSSFEIPGNLNANSGLNVITILNIVNITNPAPQCSNTANVSGNLIINPLPNAATLAVTVNNYCLHEPVSVAISGLGNLTNVKISYSLSDSNISTVQSITQTVTNGGMNFIIPAALLLNAGNTKITLLNLTNTVTNCDINLLNITDDFILNPIPVAPVAIDQKFCKVDEATIANLEPKGAQYKWYNSATATTPLVATYVLKTEDYYVKETSLAGCTSETTKISVVVFDNAAPVLNDTPDFCGLTNPTVQDLSNKTNVAATVAWYDAVNGNLLPSSTPLVHHVTYYGYDLDANTNCLSENHIEVVVSLQDCDTSQYDFFIPDGFSPNGDNVNDTFKIPDVDFLYPDYSIEIFNRYGNVMFKGNKNKPDWDGKTSASPGFGDGVAPSGVYFYVIYFNKDNRPPKQGRLYLNR